MHMEQMVPSNSGVLPVLRSVTIKVPSVGEMVNCGV